MGWGKGGQQKCKPITLIITITDDFLLLLRLYYAQ